MNRVKKSSRERCGKEGNRMSKFKGFEVVPATTFGCSNWSAIRITVSAKKVGLSRPLIDAMGAPTSITVHRGVGENEGMMIIAAAESADDQGQIHINLDNKKICFSDSVFAESCADMIQTYGGGSFKKGTYYSINGTKVDEGAYVFNFREAVEHNVKMGTRGIAAGASRQRANSFSIADRNGAQDRVTPIPARGYGIPERSARG